MDLIISPRIIWMIAIRKLSQVQPSFSYIQAIVFDGIAWCRRDGLVDYEDRNGDCKIDEDGEEHNSRGCHGTDA